jgi:hypothetical protein
MLGSTSEEALMTNPSSSKPSQDISGFHEVWVVAPIGFRPSQWCEMLIDFDEAYDLDPHLIDKRCHGREEVMVMQPELFDENHPDATVHLQLLSDILEKIARMGLSLNYHPQLQQSKPEIVTAVVAHCQLRSITLLERSELS